MVNLCDYDKEITESEFKSKVDSMFMMLYISIMTDNLKRVSHLVHDSLLQKYKLLLNKLNSQNERQMYDLLHIKETEIENTKVLNGKAIITVKLITQYMDYVVNKTTKKIIRGNNQEQIEKTIYLTLEQNSNESSSTSYNSISNIKDFNWKLIDLKAI